MKTEEIKKIALYAFAVLWIIGSIVYIAYDIWSDYKIREVGVAYQQGYSTAVNDLIQQAGKCEVFPVNSGTTKVELINVSCLKKAAEAAPEASAPTE